MAGLNRPCRSLLIALEHIECSTGTEPFCGPCIAQISISDKYVSALAFISAHEECRVGGADASGHSSGYSLERLIEFLFDLREYLNIQIASLACMKGTIPIT